MASLINRGHKRRTINEINMVPFIDVMLVLLIIFMVTAPLITPAVINLPSVGKGSTLPDNVVQIIINQDESIELKIQKESTTLPLTAIADAIRQLDNPHLATVISADKNVKYESVMRVMDTLRRAGIQHVGLLVQIAN